MPSFSPFHIIASSEMLVASEWLAIGVLYLAGIAFGRWLKRKHRVQLGGSFYLLCFVAPYYAIGSLWPAGLGFTAPVHRHTGPIALFLLTVFALALVHRFYWEWADENSERARTPKFLRQLITLAVLLLTGLMVLQFGYNVDISTPLAASGILAVVIGFAMQETLANIISGIALQISQPFRVGDWLMIDGSQSQVVEVNWRSTRLRNNDDIAFDIPNKTLVAGTITNLTYPTRAHARRIRIGFDYNTPPNIVKDTLLRAVSRATGVLSQPPPKIFLHAFGDSAVVYEVKYSLDDESRFNDIHDAIHTNIWYEAKRAGLTIPFPIRTIRVERPDRKSGEAHETARSQLQKHALFECLDEGLTQELLSDSRLLRFGRGETIIEQGAPGHSMFVILHGTVEVFVAKGGVTHLVATLATSDAFGEMSLLTGEPRTASVIATTDCELWEIQKPALQAILKESPVLADRLSEMLAKRKLQQEALDSAAPPSAAAVAQQRAALKAGFLRRISTFFEL